MEKKIYSHSRISCFEQCPLKYKLRYIDKIIPEIEKSIELHLGDSVHKTLEWLYLEVKKEKIPTIENLIVYYTEIWNQNYLDSFVIVNVKLTQKDYFNKGIEFILNYYAANYPFDDNTIEVEKKILMNLEKDILLQGFIDRIAHNNETGEIEIHDYKTSNSLPEKTKIEKDRQLSLYAIAIKEEFGYDKEISLIWHYLAYNKKIKSKKTNQDLEEIKKITIDLIRKIESTREFNPNCSVLCKWCEYRKICSDVEKNKKNELDKYPMTKKYIRDD